MQQQAEKAKMAKVQDHIPSDTKEHMKKMKNNETEGEQTVSKVAGKDRHEMMTKMMMMMMMTMTKEEDRPRDDLGEVKEMIELMREMAGNGTIQNCEDLVHFTKTMKMAKTMLQLQQQDKPSGSTAHLLSRQAAQQRRMEAEEEAKAVPGL